MFDRARCLAFVSSGAIWTAGSSLGLRVGPVLVLLAAAYVLSGGLALARPGEPTRVTWVVLWASAVALVSFVLVPVAGFFAVLPGLLFGTLCFGAWTSTGFMLLHFFTRNRRSAQP